jgi:hypothetical protein
MLEEVIHLNSDEDEIDGCDVEIEEENITLDEDLPASEGGVA